MTNTMTSEAVDLLDELASRFRDELATIACADCDPGESATAEDVMDSLDVILNSRPDWATKPRH